MLLKPSWSFFNEKGNGKQAHNTRKEGFINLLGTFLTRLNQIFDLILVVVIPSYAQPVSLRRIQKTPVVILCGAKLRILLAEPSYAEKGNTFRILLAEPFFVCAFCYPFCA